MDNLTILTCVGDKNKATKVFSMREDSSIEKRSFAAGLHFKYEQKAVSSLSELADLLETLLHASNKFVIRGAPKGSAGEVVRRKTHPPHAAFESTPRHYVMFDFDKLQCPNYFDASKNPEAIVNWARETLPPAFKKASCYYKFSASQNIGEGSTVSLHLWFWFEQAVSDDELKRYFRAHPAPVDIALFNPVQIHYTARPLFEGMADPLPKRSGVLRGDYDSVPPLDIPPAVAKSVKSRPQKEPEVPDENRTNALNLLLPYYKKGTRDRFCGAVAGVLYRGGWNAENVASFVHELALNAHDDEADARCKSALRICAAIDDGRPAQGVPTLRDEFNIDGLGDILTLLGVGKSDIEKEIAGLLGVSDADKISEVMKLLVPFPRGKQKAYIAKIKAITGESVSTLNALLSDVSNEVPPASAIDKADVMIERLLSWEFEGGRYLMRASDGLYWHYTGTHWEPIAKDAIKKRMIHYARGIIAESDDTGVGVSTLLTAGFNIIEGRVYNEDNPLHALATPPVINCLNGELWFGDNADIVLKPHSAESYLKHCLNVFYDPTAKAPLFEKAVLEVFGQSADPQDMFRHFMELGGYICQPWRGLAKIVLLYGGGNNGKSSLMKIVQKVLGDKMIAFDRMGAMENNVFKIGALDGKLMLLDDDMDEGTCLPDGFLKKISEEKSITGQHKYKPPFEFVCRVVPVMLSNTYPASRDVSEGMRRRMMVIPFARQFKPDEVKIGLFDRIWEQEAAGILNHFINGFQRLKLRGKFDEPKDCLISKTDWFTRSNTLPTFIAECCEVSSGAGCWQYIGDFYKAFEKYCAEIGVRNVMKQPTVADRLESLGYRIAIRDGKRAVYGLRIRAEGGLAVDLR